MGRAVLSRAMRLTTGALAVVAAVTLAACSSSTQHNAAPTAAPKAPAPATTSAPVAASTTTAPPTPAPAKTTAPPPPAATATKDSRPPVEAFWADDKKAPDRPDLDTYRTKWAYLQQECTEQGQDLADIVIKTQARQGSASRWDAMNYMSALLSGPPSACAPFAGG